MVELKLGKRYTARNGQVTDPLHLRKESVWGFGGKLPGDNFTRSWQADGTWGVNPGADFDLVAEFPFLDDAAAESWRHDGTWALDDGMEVRQDILKEYVEPESITNPNHPVGLVLEIGSFYRTRGGDIVGPLEFVDVRDRSACLEDYAFTAELNGRELVWTQEGYYDRFSSKEPCISEEDLMEVIPAKIPAEGKFWGTFLKNGPTPSPEESLEDDLVDWALQEMTETEETGTEFSEGYRFAIKQMLEGVLGLELVQRTEYGVREISED